MGGMGEVGRWVAVGERRRGDGMGVWGGVRWELGRRKGEVEESGRRGGIVGSDGKIGSSGG